MVVTRLPPHHGHAFYPVGSAQFLYWVSTQDKTLKCKQKSTITRTKRLHSECWVGVFETSNCKFSCRVEGGKKARVLI